MQYKFGDVITIDNQKAVVTKVVKKRKYTYYFVILEGANIVCDDWDNEGMEGYYYREDEL